MAGVVQPRRDSVTQTSATEELRVPEGLPPAQINRWVDEVRQSRLGPIRGVVEEIPATPNQSPVTPVVDFDDKATDDITPEIEEGRRQLSRIWNSQK